MLLQESTALLYSLIPIPYSLLLGLAARGKNSSAAMPRNVSQDLQPGHCQRKDELSRPHSLQR
jgi:hypothetical protein